MIQLSKRPGLPPIEEGKAAALVVDRLKNSERKVFAGEKCTIKEKSSIIYKVSDNDAYSLLVETTKGRKKEEKDIAVARAILCSEGTTRGDPWCKS